MSTIRDVTHLIVPGLPNFYLPVPLTIHEEDGAVWAEADDWPGWAAVADDLAQILDLAWEYSRFIKEER